MRGQGTQKRGALGAKGFGAERPAEPVAAENGAGLVGAVRRSGVVPTKVPLFELVVLALGFGLCRAWVVGTMSIAGMYRLLPTGPLLVRPCALRRPSPAWPGAHRPVTVPIKRPQFVLGIFWAVVFVHERPNMLLRMTP